LHDRVYNIDATRVRWLAAHPQPATSTGWEGGSTHDHGALNRKARSVLAQTIQIGMHACMHMSTSITAYSPR